MLPGYRKIGPRWPSPSGHLGVESPEVIRSSSPSAESTRRSHRTPSLLPKGGEALGEVPFHEIVPWVPSVGTPGRSSGRLSRRRVRCRETSQEGRGRAECGIAVTKSLRGPIWIYDLRARRHCMPGDAPGEEDRNEPFLPKGIGNSHRPRVDADILREMLVTGLEPEASHVSRYPSRR